MLLAIMWMRTDYSESDYISGSNANEPSIQDYDTGFHSFRCLLLWLHHCLAARRRAERWCWRNGLPALWKSEIGLCGVVGGMMVIELLAGKMRLDRGGIAAGEDDMRQTYTVKHIRKGLTLLN